MTDGQKIVTQFLQQTNPGLSLDQIEILINLIDQRIKEIEDEAAIQKSIIHDHYDMIRSDPNY